VIEVTGGAEPVADRRKRRRGELVPAHRKGVARRREDAGVRGRNQRENRRNNYYNNAEFSERLFSRNGDRRQRASDASWIGDADQHRHDCDIEHGGKRQRAENPQRDVPAGVFDLFGDTGDLGHTRIRDEHEASRRQQAADTITEEVRVVRRLHTGRTASSEPTQRRQHHDDDDQLEPTGLFGSEDVHENKHRCKPKCDRFQREIEQQQQVGNAADERERTFKR